MTRYKATISYDGTDFAGFQVQPNQRTVQAEIEKVLARLNGEKSCGLQGAGRTDAGVHALGQVIHFDLEDQRETERIRFALDTQTPADISIWKLEKVADDFHARYNKHEKIYEYRLDNAASRNPMKRRYEAWYRYPLDLASLSEALSALTGQHDFTGFTASGTKVVNKVRRIDSASVEKIGSTFVFTFRGNGFLYKQVRNMVGTLIKIGSGKFPVGRIDEILETKNRALAGPTARPEGLYLKEVIYTGGKFEVSDYAKEEAEND